MSRYTAAPGWCEPVVGIVYRTLEPLHWDIGREGSGLTFTVPAGTVFDLSVPRVLRWLIDPHDRRLLKAAAVHDAMLDDGWSRVTAGAEFHEAMRADGVGRWRRLIMWLGVSLWRWT